MPKKQNFQKAITKTNGRMLPDAINNAINDWEKNHDEDLLDANSIKLRRLLHDYLSEDAINTVAHKYSDIYINAVKKYMHENKLNTVSDLLAFFGDKSYGADFFPEFTSFITKYVMNAVSVKQIPKMQFVKSGESFVKYVENTDNEDLGYLDTGDILSFYDRDTNTIFFKEDNIADFDTFMTHLSHEISHAIDTLDYTKGAFDNETVYKYARKLYTINGKENKYNPEEKSATRIGVVTGKNFTRKLEQSLNKAQETTFIQHQFCHQK